MTKKLRPRIVFTYDCQWDIPLAWWRLIAQPRFAQLVINGARDASLVTYEILRGETGTCPLPPNPDVVVDPPNDPNFWNGPPTALYLFQHVREAVAGGLQTWLSQDQAGTPTLSLPPDVLGT